MFLNCFYLSPAVTLVQEHVAPNERVLAGALLLLVMNLVGLGLGPTFLGAMSDWLRPAHPEHSLQLAFYTLVPFYVLAVLCFLWLARAMKRRKIERRPHDAIPLFDLVSHAVPVLPAVADTRSRRRHTRRQSAG